MSQDRQLIQIQKLVLGPKFGANKLQAACSSTSLAYLPVAALAIGLSGSQAPSGFVPV